MNEMVNENEEINHPLYGKMKPIVLNTRESCIEDEILIENDLTKRLVKEAGFNISIAFGHVLWGDYIVPSEEDIGGEGQDLEARLWDVLTVFKFMAVPKLFEYVGEGKFRPIERMADFKVDFVVNGQTETVEIWAALTSDKDGNLAINIFLPSEY